MRRLNAPLLALVAVTLSSLDANAGGHLVDIRSADPTIIVELRYAGRNNLVGYPLYPQGTCALARPEVASGLAAAQAFLRRYQFGLKIWDAYRPVARHTTAITLPTLKLASGPCTVGVSLSMRRWSIRGIVPCGCPATLTILHLPQCGVTPVIGPIFARTCICSRRQCEMQAFGDYAPSGGISRSPIGKNICRTRRHEPHRSAVRSGKVSYDRGLDP